MRDRNLNHSNNWSTPIDLYDRLNKEFEFDFDPCPLNSEFDGLTKEWGQSNFINPPYSKDLKNLFIDKAIEQYKKGKKCVMLLPVSTSTKIFHEKILPNARKIIFIKGRLKFTGFNGNGKLVNNQNAMHDSMIIVLDGISKEQCVLTTWKNHDSQFNIEL